MIKFIKRIKLRGAPEDGPNFSFLGCRGTGCIGSFPLSVGQTAGDSCQRGSHEAYDIHRLPCHWVWAKQQATRFFRIGVMELLSCACITTGWQRRRATSRKLPCPLALSLFLFLFYFYIFIFRRSHARRHLGLSFIEVSQSHRLHEGSINIWVFYFMPLKKMV